MSDIYEGVIDTVDRDERNNQHAGADIGGLLRVAVRRGFSTRTIVSVTARAGIPPLRCP